MKLDKMHAYSINEQRAAATANNFINNQPSLEINGRGVLFLTERCNLDCLYCKRAKYSKRDFTIEEAKQAIEEWSKYNSPYLHLTGGEVTIFRGLENIVKFAKEKGIISSLSTNGMADQRLYKQLVNNGAKFFYISLDTDKEKKCDEITGVKGSYNKILGSIAELVSLRETGKDIYLTINILIGDYNFKRIKAITNFVKDLHPDDFKLIPTTKFMNNLTEKEKEKLKQLKEKDLSFKDQFHMFHYRLEHFENMRGLKNIQDLKCYVCTDERTFGPDFYYPCSIYFREGGKPIGSHKKDNFKTQAKKLLEFSKTHNILEDPICREFCCDITRDFNLDVHNLVLNT